MFARTIVAASPKCGHRSSDAFAQNRAALPAKITTAQIATAMIIANVTLVR